MHVSLPRYITACKVIDCVTGPILLGCDVANDLNSTPWQDLQPHKDEHQVSLDVDRAFVYYPKGVVH